MSEPIPTTGQTAWEIARYRREFGSFPTHSPFLMRLKHRFIRWRQWNPLRSAGNDHKGAYGVRGRRHMQTAGRV